MPGTATHSDSTAYEQRTDAIDVVDDSLDLDLTVWLPTSDTAECYHTDTEWGPACVEHIGFLERGTLAEAIERELRPCSNCNPQDYRRVATDGGVDVHGRGAGRDMHREPDLLATVARLTNRAALVARDVGLDETRDRLRLAYAGVVHLNVDRDLVEQRLVEIDRHLSAASDVATTDDVRVPVRDALVLIRHLQDEGGL